VKTPKQDEALQAEPERPAPVAKHNVPDVTSDLFGSLNAHPVAGRTTEKNQAEIAPTVSASTPASLSAAGTPEIIPPASTVELPVPSQTIPGTVLQAGGLVPEPRLLSSTLPTYPAAAKQTRTEGDIVVRTVIDERGQVTNPQVVAGPTLLRQAAIEAVKHWKYEPSHVNGKPVPVQILLTIHFRL
jgi:TonB family protein